MNLFLLFTVFGLGSTVSVNNCPPNLKRDRYLKIFGETCFKIHLDAFDYDHAKMICEKDNGILAMPKTREINHFLAQHLTENVGNYHEFWIGLSVRNKERSIFQWEDGSPLTWNSWSLTEESLYPNEHDDRNREDECATIHTPYGSWHQYYCQTNDLAFSENFNYFVCQYPANVSLSTTIKPTSSATVCSPIICDLDCGMVGYNIDENNCVMCQCRED